MEQNQRDSDEMSLNTQDILSQAHQMPKTYKHNPKLFGKAALFILITIILIVLTYSKDFVSEHLIPQNEGIGKIKEKNFIKSIDHRKRDDVLKNEYKTRKAQENNQDIKIVGKFQIIDDECFKAQNCQTFCNYTKSIQDSYYNILPKEIKFNSIHDKYFNSSKWNGKKPVDKIPENIQHSDECIFHPTCYERYEVQEILCMPLYIWKYMTERGPFHKWRNIEVYSPSGVQIAYSRDKNDFSVAIRNSKEKIEEWIRQNEKSIIDYLYN